jgi:hypothetical protein
MEPPARTLPAPQQDLDEAQKAASKPEKDADEAKQDAADADNDADKPKAQADQAQAEPKAAESKAAVAADCAKGPHLGLRRAVRGREHPRAGPRGARAALAYHRGL